MPSKTKILFTSENVTWGGSELLWTKTVVELVRLQYTIAICIHPKLQLPDWILTLEKQYEIIVFRLSIQPLSKVKRIFNKIIPYSYQFKPKKHKEEIIKKFQPDLLIINQGFNFNAVDVMQFAKTNTIQYVTISHAVNEGLWPNLSLRKKMLFGFENSRQNYFVSHDNLELTQVQIASFLSNSKVIRNPFNVPFVIDIDYPNTARYELACVGRFDFNAKGQDILLKVLSSDKWKNRNLIVNFYGEGNDTENLKDLIAMYGISNAILHPYTAPIDIWKQNQGLILASRYEGLPIVIVEAMLAKRFVIVTNVSGNKELIQDSVTGFLAAAPRPEYLDEAMERAWIEKDNWKAMGEQAREKVVYEIPENPALFFATDLIQQLDY